MKPYETTHCPCGWVLKIMGKVDQVEPCVKHWRSSSGGSRRYANIWGVDDGGWYPKLILFIRTFLGYHPPTVFGAHFWRQLQVISRFQPKARDICQHCWIWESTRGSLPTLWMNTCKCVSFQGMNMPFTSCFDVHRGYMVLTQPYILRSCWCKSLLFLVWCPLSFPGLINMNVPRFISVFFCGSNPSAEIPQTTLVQLFNSPFLLLPHVQPMGHPHVSCPMRAPVPGAWSTAKNGFTAGVDGLVSSFFFFFLGAFPNQF